MRPLAKATPVRRGRTVVLQRWADGRWATVGRGQQTSAGTVRFAARAPWTARTYRYRAVAMPTLAGAVSAVSTSRSLTVRARDVTPPRTPVDVNPTITDGRLTVTWSPVRAADLDGYEVLVRDLGGSYEQGFDLRAHETSLTLEGLDPTLTYTASVLAYDRVGNRSPWSAAVIAGAGAVQRGGRVHR